MAQEIDIGGTRYIASKIAATRTGYTQDYIGQLARGGHIEAKRVSGMWYILEDSLRNYKEKADQYVPQPPQGILPKHEADVSVSFDGKDYVSAHRAAVITGYHQDYVGQLARSGQILSRQVGNRWYVDRDSLLRHQKEKERLLAELQSKSVGIVRPTTSTAPSVPTAEDIRELETHFNYVQEVALIPEPIKPEDFQDFEGTQTASTDAEFAHEEAEEAEINIPIRVVAPEEPTFSANYVYEDDSEPKQVIHTGEDGQKSHRKRYVFGLAGLVLVAALGTLVYNVDTTGVLKTDALISSFTTSENASRMNPVVKNTSKSIENLAQTLFGKELVYTRK